MSIQKLRARMAKEPRFRERVMQEVMLQIALGMGIINTGGSFADPAIESRVQAADPRVGGRPLRHYRGLTVQQLKGMGLSDKDLEVLSEHITFSDAPGEIPSIDGEEEASEDTESNSDSGPRTSGRPIPGSRPHPDA